MFLWERSFLEELFFRDSQPLRVKPMTITPSLQN
jgi:hypothetical protein